MHNLNDIDIIKEVQQALIDYRVRRLNIDVVQELYDFCKANTRYYKYMRMEPTMENIAYIGWFMVNKDIQGKGIGRKIIDKAIEVLRNVGFCAVMLGCIKDNVEAYRFWTNNGFENIGKETDTGDYILVEMRKEL